MALLGRPDPISVDTLISLSADTSSLVRDWATFGLGTMVDVDTPKVRKALLTRLKDSDCDTRCEAIAGLAKRKDPKVKEALVRELKRKHTTTLVFEAAAEFGDRTFLPYIQRHLLAAQGEKDLDAYWLRVVRDAEEALSGGNHLKLGEDSNP